MSDPGARLDSSPPLWILKTTTTRFDSLPLGQEPCAFDPALQVSYHVWTEVDIFSGLPERDFRLGCCWRLLVSLDTFSRSCHQPAEPEPEERGSDGATAMAGPPPEGPPPPP